jgi:prevent-host-death family protein
MTNIDPMARSLTIANAKAHLSDAIKRAENGEAVVLTRYGRAVAALISVEDLDRLQGRGGPGLAGLAGGWAGSEELAEEIEAVRANRGPPRRRR